MTSLAAGRTEDTNTHAHKQVEISEVMRSSKVVPAKYCPAVPEKT